MNNPKTREEAGIQVTNFIMEKLNPVMKKTTSDGGYKPRYNYQGHKFIVTIDSAGMYFVAYHIPDKYTLRIELANCPYEGRSGEKTYFDKRITTRDMKLDMKDVVKKLDNLIEMKARCIKAKITEDKTKKERKSYVDQYRQDLVECCKEQGLVVDSVSGSNVYISKFGSVVIKNNGDKPYYLQGYYKGMNLDGVLRLITLYLEVTGE